MAQPNAGTQPALAAQRHSKKPFVKPLVEDLGHLTLVTLTTGLGGQP